MKSVKHDEKAIANVNKKYPVGTGAVFAKARQAGLAERIRSRN